MKKILFLLVAAGLFLGVAGSVALAEQIVCEKGYTNCNAACAAAGGTCISRSCVWSNSCPSGKASWWCADSGSSLCSTGVGSGAFCKCTDAVVIPGAPPKVDIDTPPTVDVTHSPQNPTTENAVKIKAVATDDKGLTEIGIYVDGTRVKTCGSSWVPKLECETVSKTYNAGEYNYYAIAYDNKQQSTTSKVWDFSVSAPLCKPKTSCSSGKNCGEESDNCGGTIKCGPNSGLCSGGQVCSDGTCIVDTMPPTVTGTYSPSFPTISDTITFSASATDASGIQYTGVSVFGTGSYTCSWKSTCSRSWGPFLSRTYTFRAYAQDNSPNQNYGYADYSFCVRKTSCSAGKNCGTEPDGCEWNIDCGTCGGGQVCYKPSGSTSGACADPHWTETDRDLSVPVPCAARVCYYPSICNNDGTCAYSVSPPGTSCAGGRCYLGSCDTVPPVTTISLNPPLPDGINNWYVSKVTAFVTCRDAGSGCEKIYYTSDNEAYWYDIPATSTPFTYGLGFWDGTYHVKAYSTDKATLQGSRVQAPVFPIKVDTVPPSVSVTGAPSGWQRADASAGVSCSDSGSGCDSGTYKLKIYPSNPGSCSSDYNQYMLAPPQTVSSHTWICAAAKDKAGKAGFSLPVEFRVDQIPPQVNPYGIPFPPCDTDPNLAPNPDPSKRWIDCSATASLATKPPSDGCTDAGSGCKPSSYGFIKYYEPPASCPAAKSSYSSKAPQLDNLTWVCGYAEDNVGNAAVSSPTKFMVNRTFVIEINARTYGEIDVPPGTEVKAYLCDPSQYYCNHDAKYLESGSAITNDEKRFRVTFVKELVRGLTYKIGVQTEKGYAESQFVA